MGMAPVTWPRVCVIPVSHLCFPRLLTVPQPEVHSQARARQHSVMDHSLSQALIGQWCPGRIYGKLKSAETPSH